MHYLTFSRVKFTCMMTLVIVKLATHGHACFSCLDVFLHTHKSLISHSAWLCEYADRGNSHAPGDSLLVDVIKCIGELCVCSKHTLSIMYLTVYGKLKAKCMNFLNCRNMRVTIYPAWLILLLDSIM